MKPSTSDFSLMILFNEGMQAQLPLGTEDKLGNKKFPIPVSFIMGQEDWVRYLDEDYGQTCVNAREINKDTTLPNNQRGNYIFCPKSGHQMHMDNPIAFTNIIINELVNKELPVLIPSEYK